MKKILMFCITICVLTTFVNYAQTNVDLVGTLNPTHQSVIMIFGHTLMEQELNMPYWVHVMEHQLSGWTIRQVHRK